MPPSVCTTPPFLCSRPQPPSQPVSPASLRLLLLFTRQFVVVRPLLSLLLCSLQLLDLAPPPLPLVFSLLFNASVYVAVYALLLFFHTFEPQLAPHRPLAKFLCVKGIVFAAFWQVGLALRRLAMAGGARFKAPCNGRWGLL